MIVLLSACFEMLAAVTMVYLAKAFDHGELALACKRCGEILAYSEVGNTLEDYYFPAKPDVPAEGIVCECPTCKCKFPYQQYELICTRQHQNYASGKAGARLYPLR